MRGTRAGRRYVRLGVLTVSTLVLSGCSTWFGGWFSSGVTCEDPTRYEGSVDVARVIVPEHLPPLNDNNALWVPPPPTAQPESVAKLGECLESPPLIYPSLG